MRFLLGLASYYLCFIENFGKIAAALTQKVENNSFSFWMTTLTTLIRNFVHDSQMRLYLYTPILESNFFSTPMLQIKESALYCHKSAKINLIIQLRILAVRLENISGTTRLGETNFWLLSKAMNTTDAIYTSDSLYYAPTMW